MHKFCPKFMGYFRAENHTSVYRPYGFRKNFRAGNTAKLSYYYHSRLESSTSVICVAGSQHRVKNFASKVNKEFLSKLDEPLNLCKTDRYSVYKVGPILFASHGMGVPSMSILLHEIIKLLHYAGASDFVFFRIGTCGGLDVEPGTIVVTKQAVDGLLRPCHEKVVLGKRVEYPTELSSDLLEEILSYAADDNITFPLISGDTMCTDDFYEGQARVDGAFCSYSKDDSKAFLKIAHAKGVRNIEMESLVFASMCRRAGIKGSVMCVVLVNRFENDQVVLTKDQMKEFQMRPLTLLLRYVTKHVKSKK